ncbi:MAG: hypothetical protein J6P87_03070, partial [Lachnospiraceae bacterium]|nr:hypothetical protein [Lachnospiraceae bacterium]
MDKDRENGIYEEDFFDDDISNTAEIKLMEEIASKKEEKASEEEEGFFDDDVSNTAEIRLMEGYDRNVPEFSGTDPDQEEDEEEEIFELEGNDKPHEISRLEFILTEKRRLVIEIAVAAAVLLIIALGGLFGARH